MRSILSPFTLAAVLLSSVALGTSCSSDKDDPVQPKPEAQKGLFGNKLVKTLGRSSVERDASGRVISLKIPDNDTEVTYTYPVGTPGATTPVATIKKVDTAYPGDSVIHKVYLNKLGHVERIEEDNYLSNGSKWHVTKTFTYDSEGYLVKMHSLSGNTGIENSRTHTWSYAAGNLTRHAIREDGRSYEETLEYGYTSAQHPQPVDNTVGQFGFLVELWTRDEAISYVSLVAPMGKVSKHLPVILTLKEFSRVETWGYTWKVDASGVPTGVTFLDADGSSADYRISWES